MIRSFNENQQSAPSWWSQFRQQSSMPTFAPSPISSFARNTLGATNPATGTYFDPSVNAYRESPSFSPEESSGLRTPTDVYREERFNEAEVERQRRLAMREMERSRQAQVEQRRMEEMMRQDQERRRRENQARMRQGYLPLPNLGGTGAVGIGAITTPPTYRPVDRYMRPFSMGSFAGSVRPQQQASVF